MPLIASSSAGDGPTLNELVTEVVTKAQGFAIAPDRIIALKGDIDGEALSFQVEGDASPGVFEVGDELIYVTAVNAQTGTCEVHPRGRGWMGSVPTTHSAGDFVTSAPAFPRYRVRAAINDTLLSLAPAVFAVGTTVVTTDETYAVEVPAETESVLDVRIQCDDEWHRLRHWEAEMSSRLGATGKVVMLPRTEAGKTVQVVYGTRPAILENGEDRWVNTGLSLGLKDAVVTGVLADFAQYVDIGRLTDRFVTPRGDNQQPQLTAGFQMADRLRRSFRDAVDREARALRNRYPARQHFTR